MAKAQYAENKKKMKHPLRSAVTTTGRRMAGARSLWRANGMREEQFGRPVIGIANSFTQLVPGHVHLHEIGQYVKQRIEALGCFAAEFNTIAIDDGIAMGHDGMLYSLPSREIIADSVEYMANAHRVDALVCISNCDKITPGMLMAAMRLDIPTVFVPGGPMEAGHLGERALDLIDAMVMAADENCSDEQVARVERAACPGCGSCSGMFTANSMNCLTEALGLSLPGNGTVVATHVNRRRLFEEAAALIVRNAERYYFEGDDSVLPRSVATKAAFENAMSLDIAMGGSTNTVLHLLAVAHEAGVDFTMQDIDRLSRRVPVLCKVAPNSHYHIQDVNRAGGILSILGELARGGLLDTSAGRVDGRTLGQAIAAFDLRSETASSEAKQRYLSAPAGLYSRELGTQRTYYDTPDTDRTAGCIRDLEHAYFRDGGLAVLTGNIARCGCVVKTAGVPQEIWKFRGPALVVDSQEQAIRVLPVLLFVNAMRNQLSIPPTFINAEQLINLFGLRDTARQFGRPQSVFDSSFNPLTFSTTVKYLAFFAGQEWLRHMRFLEWDPKQAEQDAKDEDERKSREALAKKYNLTSDGDNAASDADLDSSADSNLSEDSDSSEEAGSEPTEE